MRFNKYYIPFKSAASIISQLKEGTTFVLHQNEWINYVPHERDLCHLMAAVNGPDVNDSYRIKVTNDGRREIIRKFGDISCSSV